MREKYWRKLSIERKSKLVVVAHSLLIGILVDKLIQNICRKWKEVKKYQSKILFVIPLSRANCVIVAVRALKTDKWTQMQYSEPRI